MARDPLETTPASDGARAALSLGIEMDLEGTGIWEWEYSRTIGNKDTALLLFSTEPHQEVELAILRMPGNRKLSIYTHNERPRGAVYPLFERYLECGVDVLIFPATDTGGKVLTTAAELVKAFRLSSAWPLLHLTVDRPELPIPVTGDVREDVGSVVNSVSSATRKPARTEILGRFAICDRLGELVQVFEIDHDCRKFGQEHECRVVFLPPDVIAIREELRQVLEGQRARSVPNNGRNAASQPKGRRVVDTPEAIAQRGEIRSRWLDNQISVKVWSESNIKRPTYKTLMRFRSGILSNRDLSVRSDLANTFGCKLDEVPR
jgi:hypothetical protein